MAKEKSLAIFYGGDGNYAPDGFRLKFYLSATMM